jgi:hypothetical protein
VHRSRAFLVVLSIPVLLAVLHADRSAAQIAVGTFDGFQDGTTQGWVAGLAGATPTVPPTTFANTGPTGAGDFALRLTSTGAVSGAGGRLVVNNVDLRWTGDYTAAGVVSIMLDVNNLNAFPLTLRLGFAEPPPLSVGGRWVTSGRVVPASSGWQTLDFSIAPEDLLPGDVLASDVDVTLANVGVIRLLHSVEVMYRGEAIVAQLDVDNVEAVPEPSLWLGLLAGGLLLRRMGVERRRL